MDTSVPLLVLLVGSTIILAILIKAGLERIGVPSLIGFLILGFLLRLCDSQWGFLSEESQSIYEFLANIGIISLLFRVGLESNFAGLVGRLGNASSVWIGNILFSAVLAHDWSTLRRRCGTGLRRPAES